MKYMYITKFDCVFLKLILLGLLPLAHNAQHSLVAIPNADTQDDATDSLSLRSFYGKNYSNPVLHTRMLLVSCINCFESSDHNGLTVHDLQVHIHLYEYMHHHP